GGGGRGGGRGGGVVGVYAGDSSFCLLHGDPGNLQLFQCLLDDEQHHAEELAAWLGSLNGAAVTSPDHPSF
ncbi:MAG: hypothetical protein ACKO1V_13090, partial [Cyanobium sp.]